MGVHIQKGSCMYSYGKVSVFSSIACLERTSPLGCLDWWTVYQDKAVLFWQKIDALTFWVILADMMPPPPQIIKKKVYGSRPSCTFIPGCC